MAALNELVRLSRLDPEWSWSRAAIISRDWRRLAPVRAYAEALGIPVEMANESLPNIWRLREMQAFVAALRADPASLLGIADLVALVNVLPQNRWTDLIAEGIATLARELADKTMPVPDLVEWFAEWSRDTRSEQRGLLLLTAHRAKGLEFDDVVILNGSWDALSKGEDADAPRRLFYVAITRVRRSLAIMASGAHTILRGENVLRRTVSPDRERELPASHAYQMPSLKVVDLSWPGRLRSGDASLAAITAARIGDPVRLVAEGEAWLIRDAQGHTLARMAKSWSPPQHRSFVRGEVGAVVRWRKADSKEEYRTHIRREEWEVVLPELVFD
ncbi:3'-5' exonuclease [Frigidibacter mobilis]|uniref:DNA helicase n=1 Tax=Frigidibacter mobilis TaxID=1335048 RepID=A0A159Z092_9RHOB|nr:3'-5' exonuclease [Frigidibacter mobilis]AMY68271.1 DNA helicase [Frigidibacter mobilis]